VSPPLIIEDTERGFAETRRRLQRQGHTVVNGWRSKAGIVSAGVVTNADDAAAALLAAVWGSGLLILATASRDVMVRFVEDLRRIGVVEYRTPGPAAEVQALTHEEHRLLELLYEGGTLGEAAQELHLSRRSADRRLASAREKLGVATTAEAVAAFQRCL
jgi:DNA-binding CsgD family transcriptional regulator